MDTQLIRNAYMGRPVEDIDMPFGKFACLYLNIEDAHLCNLQPVNAACNYILAMGYNLKHEGLSWPVIEEVQAKKACEHKSGPGCGKPGPCYYPACEK